MSINRQLSRRSPRRIRPGNPYNTDPPSSASTRRPVIERSVFDQDRLLRALKAGLIEGIPPQEHPTDELLIATVVELGCPRWSAEQMKYNPALRLAFYGMWTMVAAAAKGDPEAREIVDVARATWEEQRKLELVSDRPDGSVGFWDR